MEASTGAQRMAAAAAIADRHMADAPAEPASQTGAPDPGTSAAVQAPAEPAAPAAPAADQPALDTPFNLADVPDGVREHVERYNKQLQAAFTQKTTELAQQRQALGPLAEIAPLLERANGEDPQDRIAALNELLDPYGIEIPDDEEIETLAPATGTEGEPPAATEATLPPELEQGLKFLLEREQQRQAQETQQAQNDFKATVEKTVTDAVDGFAKRAGYESADKVPAHVRDAIIDRAIALPKTADGLPNMTAAVEAYEAWEAAVVQSYVAKKGGVPPAPDLSGSAGRAQVDLSDTAQRLQAAEAVVGRHL